MTAFDDFVTQDNGKFIEKEDSSALNQCLDLVFDWCDRQGIDRAAVRHPYAYQIWTRPTDPCVAAFWFVPSSPTNHPQNGDIVVWAQSYNGTAGHTAIASGRGDANSFDAFEQNDPTGSAAHMRTYGYTGVLGWLHKKDVPTDSQALQAQIVALQGELAAQKTLVQSLQQKITAAKTALS